MTDMKFVVLIWAVFQMFSFTTSDANSTTESYTLINSKNLAKTGCNSTCGDLVVPYPFGFGDNSECYMNEGFRIYCNTSVNPPKASITEDSYTSIKVISDSTIRVSNTVASKCYTPNGTTSNDYNNINADFTNWPYTFSEVNKFTIIGCNDYALLNSATIIRSVLTGCIVFCGRREEVVGDECTGNGCCQASVPQDIKYYTTQLYSLRNVSNRRSFAPCTYAFVGDKNVFKFNGAIDLINGSSFIERIEDTVPQVLDWAISDLDCSVAEATNGYACQLNSNCVSTRETGGYRCVCKEGYEGNPYLPPGCQDVNECENPEEYPCYGVCVNTHGSYDCRCRRGFNGNAKKKYGCKRSAGYSKFTTIIFILGVVLGTGILVLSIGVYKLIQKRKEKRRKAIFFKRNGGLLLQQQTLNGDHASETTRLFSATELEKATDQYNENRILG
ncbi:wall-associated receptor kinase 2-like protein, partial [Tanacetum coccineum]